MIMILFHLLKTHWDELVTAGFLFNAPTRLNLDSPWVKVTRTPISPVRALFDMVKSPIFAQNILRACTALISSGAICWGYRSSQAMTRRTESVLQQMLQFAVTRGVLLGRYNFAFRRCVLRSDGFAFEFIAFK
ncbi:hypothetical protein HHX47_DHR4001082 [Lentinula edodes]|nr:hypothetical protein HHX47_DHR4001082 [Lentinula edodes]